MWRRTMSCGYGSWRLSMKTFLSLANRDQIAAIVVYGYRVGRDNS